MNSGYFSGDSQVLLPNGQYTNISNIEPGDKVLNMHCEPVKVLKVHQAPANNMTEIRYQNWYTPFYCTNNLKILATEELSNNSQIDAFKWISTNNLTTKMYITCDRDIYKSITTKDFAIAITPTVVIKPTFNIGVLFGLYAGYGAIIDDKVVFRFGPNEELLEKVAELLSELEATTHIVKNAYSYHIYSTSEHIVKLFQDFGTKIKRQLPSQFWSSSLDYVEGLLDGMVEYDPTTNVRRYIPVTKDMAEVFTWCCSLLGLKFENDTPGIDNMTMRIFPLFISSDTRDETTLGKITSIDGSENIIQTCWNLHVDCPTNSVIINNLVVHT